MLALIYLALAIALGDLLCRRFYRFVSVPHRWAAAILVGILLSTLSTYLAGLAFAHTAEPLLWADLLFFVAAPGAIFWLSRKTPKVQMIAPRVPGSSTWDWVTLAVLFAGVCLLLMGTLYVNKQGRLRLSGMVASDFAPQLAIAQNFAIGHTVPTLHADQPNHHDLLFDFQAGNLQVLGLNLAWSVDALSVLGLVSMLALVMALGQLLFHSSVVGRLGAALFFFHGFPPFHFVRSQSSVQTAMGTTVYEFMKQRHLAFAISMFLVVLIFLVDEHRLRTAVTNASAVSIRAKGFVFSAVLLGALLLWDAAAFRPAALVLLCLFAAYGLYWLWNLKTARWLGRAIAATVTACFVAGGVIDLMPIYNSPRMEVNYEKETLVKGLVFRTSVIYKLPEPSPAAVLARDDLSKAPVTAFEGGHGTGRGQFDSPRGIAIDSAGNIFVADTNNGRIEKFSPSGVFIISIGTKGKGRGQFGEPNGLAIDRAGNIYVAEASNHRVQKLAADGRSIDEWAPGLYGPRRIAIGPDDSIYVVDQGRTRIVKLSPDGRVLTTWGSGGNGDGQFADHTSVAVDPVSNKIYVADPINRRIQVFDSDGNFLTKWFVPEWGQPTGFEDLAIDSQRGRLYASSANINAILVFDLQGNMIGTLTAKPPDKLNSPSALALAKDKLFVLNSGSAQVSMIDLQNR